MNLNYLKLTIIIIINNNNCNNTIIVVFLEQYNCFENKYRWNIRFVSYRKVSTNNQNELDTNKGLYIKTLT